MSHDILERITRFRAGDLWPPALSLSLLARTVCTKSRVSLPFLLLILSLAPFLFHVHSRFSYLYYTTHPRRVRILFCAHFPFLANIPALPSISFVGSVLLYPEDS